MPHYAHYKGLRYDMSLWKGDSYLLRWFDEDGLPAGFEPLDTPQGWAKGKKIIPCLEADCAYEEEMMVNYKGYNFTLMKEEGDQLLIHGLASDKESKAAGLKFIEPGIYGDWIPKSEGRIWARIGSVPPMYQGKYKHDFLTFRLRKDGYQKGECYAHYKGQRYRIDPGEGGTYLLHWYGENDFPDGFKVSDSPKQEVKAAKKVQRSEVECVYREYIMTTYKGQDYNLMDVTEEQLLIQGREEDRVNGIVDLGNVELVDQEVWIPRSEGYIWVKRDILY